MTISNSNITIVKGNIFFSELQTITVTVNCVGVMGKGIALVAKELVPDAYKFYQKLCEGNGMNLGKPVLYNKNSNQLKTANGESKTLLLFPTKEHWKMRANYGGIKRGLEWLIENYKKSNIESLAIPALGCGNGGLEWKDVGPMLYQRLFQLDIPVELYIPEKNILEKHLTEEFLLSGPSKITDF